MSLGLFFKTSQFHNVISRVFKIQISLKTKRNNIKATHYTKQTHIKNTFSKFRTSHVHNIVCSWLGVHSGARKTRKVATQNNSI